MGVRGVEDGVADGATAGDAARGIVEAIGELFAKDLYSRPRLGKGEAAALAVTASTPGDMPSCFGGMGVDALLITPGEGDAQRAEADRAMSGVAGRGTAAPAQLPWLGAGPNTEPVLMKRATLPCAPINGAPGTTEPSTAAELLTRS